MLADVVLPGRRFQVFTYQVPPPLLAHVHIGTPVTVPLGSGVVAGFVVSLFEQQAGGATSTQVRYTSLREILAVETEGGPAPLGHNLFQLIEKISDYYLTPLAACLRLIVPPHSVKVVKRVFLTDEGRTAIVNRSLPEDVQAVLRKLECAPNGLLRSTLTHSIKDASATLVSAKKKG